MTDHRIIDNNGNRIAFTCENRRFKTNIHRSAPGGRPGSVLPEPLFNVGSYSLWLEHVIDKTIERQVYWLMWYNHEGMPTIPMSGVFGRNDLEDIIRRLTTVNDQLLNGAV